MIERQRRAANACRHVSQQCFETVLWACSTRVAPSELTVRRFGSRRAICGTWHDEVPSAG